MASTYKSLQDTINAALKSAPDASGLTISQIAGMMQEKEHTPGIKERLKLLDYNPEHDSNYQPSGSCIGVVPPSKRITYN